MAAKPVSAVRHETIKGAMGPCKAYSGIATSIETFNGLQVIILAGTRSALLDAVKEINPNVQVDVSLFMPASIIADKHIDREDNEL